MRGGPSCGLRRRSVELNAQGHSISSRTWIRMLTTPVAVVGHDFAPQFEERAAVKSFSCSTGPWDLQ